MRKGTIILLFMLCLNLVAFGFTYTCTQGGNNCGQNFDNAVVRFFFNVDDTTNLNAVDGLVINETYEGQLTASLEQKTGVATILESGAIGFLDVVRMIIGFISLLTPFPFLIVIYSLGIPLLYSMLLVVTIFAMYSLAIVELVGNREF